MLRTNKSCYASFFAVYKWFSLVFPNSWPSCHFTSLVNFWSCRNITMPFLGASCYLMCRLYYALLIIMGLIIWIMEPHWYWLSLWYMVVFTLACDCKDCFMVTLGWQAVHWLAPIQSRLFFKQEGWFMCTSIPSWTWALLETLEKPSRSPKSRKNIESLLVTS